MPPENVMEQLAAFKTPSFRTPSPQSETALEAKTAVEIRNATLELERMCERVKKIGLLPADTVATPRHASGAMPVALDPSLESALQALAREIEALKHRVEQREHESRERALWADVVMAKLMCQDGAWRGEGIAGRSTLTRPPQRARSRSRRTR